MRRFVSLIVTASLATVGITACSRSSTSAQPAPSADEIGTAVVHTAPLAGDWDLSTGLATPVLSQQQRDLFDEATSTWEDVRYEPLALIAEQSGNGGASSAYLCRGSRDGSDGWAIVVVFKDSQNDPRVTSMRDLDPTRLQLVEPTDSMVFGTWPAAQISKTVALPQEVADSFAEAVAQSSYRLSPIMLLGTQQLDGTNYVLMCAGDGDGVQNAVFVATMHVDRDGTSKLTSANVLAMTYYVSGGTIIFVDE